MNKTGVTPEGSHVFSGVYMMHTTHGIPLDVMFGYMAERNAYPNWYNFITEAKREGANIERLVRKIDLPILDAWGRKAYNIIMNKIKELI